MSIKHLADALRVAVARLGEIPPNDISNSDEFGMQNVDSLGKLELIAIAEAESGIRISDAAAFDLRSIDDILIFLGEAKL